MIELTSAGPTDAIWLAAIHARAFAEPWPAADIAILIDSPGVHALAGSIGGTPVAFILCRTVVDEAEILTLATAPESRRLGVASALIDAAAAGASRAGAAALFLEVAQDNHGALALYVGKGFAEVGRRPAYYRRQSGAVAAVLMRLALTTDPDDTMLQA